MRVPISVPIAGKQVKISYPEIIPGDSPDEQDCFGDTGLGKNCTVEIRISRTKNKSERQVFETLKHEFDHAALKLSGVHNLMDEKLEEAVVESLEVGTSHLYCFNPDAAGVKWKDIPFPFEED